MPLRTPSGDEFYTRREDIELELKHYRKFFENKIVYCNCDDGNWSNFWRFFYLNFKQLKLKKLISTSYHENSIEIDSIHNHDDNAYKYVYEGGFEEYDDGSIYMNGVTKTKLSENGDFRSEECINILKEVDVVVTNPPFSLIKEFILTLEKYNKYFLIIGPMTARTYEDLFPLIKNNKMWIGYNYIKHFLQPDGTLKSFGNIHWYTNIDIEKRHILEKYYDKYDPDENHFKHLNYDNFNAIEGTTRKNRDCTRPITCIPANYTGIIGVPISWLDKYCPEQFELIGLFGSFKTCDMNKGLISGSKTEYIDKTKNKIKYGTAPICEKIPLFARILIKWKSNAMPDVEDGVFIYEHNDLYK